jgi:hypothetical protein
MTSSFAIAKTLPLRGGGIGSLGIAVLSRRASSHQKEQLRRKERFRQDGDPSPSPEDLATTAHLVRGANVLSLTILDHVIVTRDERRYYSMADRGTLPLADM